MVRHSLRHCAVEHSGGDRGVGLPDDELEHPFQLDRLFADANPTLHSLPHLVRSPWLPSVQVCCCCIVTVSAACTIAAQDLSQLQTQLWDFEMGCQLVIVGSFLVLAYLCCLYGAQHIPEVLSKTVDVEWHAAGSMWWSSRGSWLAGGWRIGALGRSRKAPPLNLECLTSEHACGYAARASVLPQCCSLPGQTALRSWAPA